MHEIWCEASLQWKRAIDRRRSRFEHERWLRRVSAMIWELNLLFLRFQTPQRSDNLDSNLPNTFSFLGLLLVPSCCCEYWEVAIKTVINTKFRSRYLFMPVICYGSMFSLPISSSQHLKLIRSKWIKRTESEIDKCEECNEFVEIKCLIDEWNWRWKRDGANWWIIEAKSILFPFECMLSLR